MMATARKIRVCLCGHPLQFHEHWNGLTYCGWCTGCSKFRQRRWYHKKG